VNRNRLEYERRVDRVIDYIRAHLAEELTLARLASVAAFSPFHFHRVFRSITNETLFDFIQRERIEKGAQALVARPDLRVLDIALHCGFASAATFARAFRAHFGMTALQWRAGGADRWRKREGVARLSARAADNDLSVQTLPAYRVAFMRYVGPYGAAGIPQLWQRLRRWMRMHDLESPQAMTLGIAYNDPSISDPDRCRYDACVPVPTHVRADRQVDIADFAGGGYAVRAFHGTASQIPDAWDRTFWALADSGYGPDDRPCVEIYRGVDPVDAASGKFRCELCLPIRPFSRRFRR
jgi:AraC family transcriptional regulator